MYYILAIVTVVVVGIIPGLITGGIAYLLAPLWWLITGIKVTIESYRFLNTLVGVAAIRYDVLNNWFVSGIVIVVQAILSLTGGVLLTMVVTWLSFFAGTFGIFAAMYFGCSLVHSLDAPTFAHVVRCSAEIGVYAGVSCGFLIGFGARLHDD